MTDAESNKLLVRSFFATAEHGDLDVIDAVVGSEYAFHDPSMTREFRGTQGAKELVTRYRSGLANLKIEIEDQLADGDHVITRFVARGTHHGDFAGVPPTGREVELAGICISRCRGGRVVEEWEVADIFGALKQIGAFPDPTD